MSTLRPSHPPERASMVQTAFRLLLGAVLLLAGTAHLTGSRNEFRAQVPGWLPLPADLVVVASGLVEFALGGALIALPRYRTTVGWIVAAFFVAVFPGNIWQYVDRIDALGMHSDRARALRLLLQPVLVAWALWATGAWQAVRAGRRAPGARAASQASDE
jgi:uncharacterized membrane protein